MLKKSTQRPHKPTKYTKLMQKTYFLKTLASIVMLILIKNYQPIKKF